MDIREKYKSVYNRLLTEVADIIFIKANGEVRVLLGTRSLNAAEQFGYDRPLVNANINSHDNRANINNSNISLFDLIIGEGRMFNVGRLVSIHWYGEISTKEQAEDVYNQHKEFTEKYNKLRENKTVSLDDLCNI